MILVRKLKKAKAINYCSTRSNTLKDANQWNSSFKINQMHSSSSLSVISILPCAKSGKICFCTLSSHWQLSYNTVVETPKPTTCEENAITAFSTTKARTSISLSASKFTKAQRLEIRVVKLSRISAQAGFLTSMLCLEKKLAAFRVVMALIWRQRLQLQRI